MRSTSRCCVVLLFWALAAQAAGVQQRQHGTSYTVASAYAPADVRAVADYVCDGTNDEVQIQQAIDALPALTSGGRTNGGEVILSQGQFNIGAQIKLRAQMCLTGQGTYSTTIKAMTPMQAKGCGAVTLNTGGSNYAVGDVLTISGGGGVNAFLKVLTTSGNPTYAVTSFEMLSTGTNYAETTGAATTVFSSTNANASGCTVNILQLCHEDLLGMAPTTSGFLQIRGIFVHGSKMAVGGGTGSAFLCSLNQITGLVPYGATGANIGALGVLYVNLAKDGATHHHVDIFSDVGRTTKIAHTAAYADAGTFPALQQLIPDTGLAVTAANWTNTGNVLTKTGAFATYIWKSGDQIYLSAGTGVTAGMYTISSKTSADAIVLASDINGAGGDIADNSVVGLIGIGGSIGFASAPTADTSFNTLYISGTTRGCGINVYGFDAHLLNLMVMYAAEDGIRSHESWGMVVDDVIAEFCYGHGLNLTGVTGSGHAKIANCKLESNSGAGLVIGHATGGSPYTMVVNSEFYGGDNGNAGLDTKPSAGVIGATGLQINSSACTISNCQFATNYTGYYGAATLATYGTDAKFVGCHFLGNNKVSVYGLNAAASNTSVTGCTFRNFTGATSYACMFNAGTCSATGSQFMACLNGVFLNAVTRCAVTGCQFNGITGTGVTGSSGDGTVVTGNVFDNCVIGVSTLNGAEHACITGNHFNIGTNGIVLGAAATAGSGLIANNTFIGQTGAAISDSSAATGLFNIRGNNGAPNYPALTRLTAADNLTITDAMMSQVIVVTVDAKVMTLPAAAAGKRVRIVNGGKDAAVLVNADPADASTLITFRGADGGAGKSLLNTKATAKSGDFIDLLGIDATHWTVVDSAGVWAAEP